jgi:hypothetical protein
MTFVQTVVAVVAETLARIASLRLRPGLLGS